jgi:hypothetical protein
MSPQTSQFLNLPIELRNHVYSFALVNHQRKIQPKIEGSRIVIHSRRTERPKAFLLLQNSSANEKPTLSCSLALSQINHQIRFELSDVLRTSTVDIVAQVRNFDFSHVIELFESLQTRRRDQFLVKDDGNARSVLYLELGGPYDADWHANVAKWIEFVEDWIPVGELKTLHRTIQDLSTTDRWCRAPRGTIIYDLYGMYQARKEGAGRLEMDKMFYTVLCRYKAELEMRGGCPKWQSDTALTGHHWLFSW